MTKPTIALLTDFGTRDHYAGVLKGVVLSICPDATVVDLSHDLPAHDIPFAALELAATYKYFPAGTIFLVVVDPGVGSARRGLAAEAGDWKFVAPDNGVLTEVFHEVAPKKVVELTERKYARPTVSRTFEGRDRFAPAAAWLAKGIQLPALGRPVSDYQVLALPRPKVEDGVLHGAVVRLDRFGNVVTNLDRKTCEKFGSGASTQVSIGGRTIARIVSTYSEIAVGELGALFGSTDHLEFAAHAASAAEVLGVHVGDAVAVKRS
ncbi:MAG: SAM-dependent chlorinase/fluorinase [Acidobacteria bacterium]|nr:SAM-dependent chlorinase/fluorinase [Acidobacteriota bacterium]